MNENLLAWKIEQRKLPLQNEMKEWTLTSRLCVEIKGPRMESWGTPALTGYFCENVTSKTTLKAACYWEKTKQGQISDSRFYKS